MKHWQDQTDNGESIDKRIIVDKNYHFEIYLIFFAVTPNSGELPKFFDWRGYLTKVIVIIKHKDQGFHRDFSFVW